MLEYTRHKMINRLNTYPGFVGAVDPEGVARAWLHGINVAEHFQDEHIQDVILAGDVGGMRTDPDCWYAWLELLIADQLADAAEQPTVAN